MLALLFLPQIFPLKIDFFHKVFLLIIPKSSFLVLQGDLDSFCTAEVKALKTVNHVYLD